jgi:hypothetical protein
VDIMSSTIDGTLALAGMVVALVVSGWALIASGSTTIEGHVATPAPRAIVKTAA